MKKEYVICAFLSGVVVAALLACYVNLTIGGLPRKVANLQTEIELLKAQPDSARAFLTDLQQLELKIEKTEHSIREDYDWLKKFGLPLTLITLIGLFYSVYKSALGFALENAKKTVDRYYMPDEERLKQEKKLLVLTKEGGDSKFIQQLLWDTGFQAPVPTPNSVKNLDEETLQKILDGEKYDLILLNNEKEPFTNQEIQMCHDKTPSFTTIFSFGNPAPNQVVRQEEDTSNKPDVVKTKQDEKKEQQGKLSSDLIASPRVSSANFKSQLYGNLINALKYQQYLRKPSTTKQA